MNLGAADEQQQHCGFDKPSLLPSTRLCSSLVLASLMSLSTIFASRVRLQLNATPALERLHGWRSCHVVLTNTACFDVALLSKPFICDLSELADRDKFSVLKRKTRLHEEKCVVLASSLLIGRMDRTVGSVGGGNEASGNPESVEGSCKKIQQLPS